MTKPQRNYPRRSLDKSLAIARAIVENGAGEPLDRLLVAEAVGRTPGSSEFKTLLSCSRMYGLTNGTEKADNIELTPLASKILKPLSLVDEAQGKLEAVLNVDAFKKVLIKFDKNKVPDKGFFGNMLERQFSIPAPLTTEFTELILENSAYTGILQNISGSNYIRLNAVQAQQGVVSDVDEIDDDFSLSTNIRQTEDISTFEDAVNDETLDQSPAQEIVQPERPKQLFVAHGKDHSPLNDLKKVLDQFKIPYKVAIDEANKGQPISKKVAALMNDCSAGIFVFTKDEQFFQKDVKSDEFVEIWRPSENAIYELGAASIIYGTKIIILKEDGVVLPSDFSDLGYINFAKDGINSKALDILKELVGLGLVKVQAA